MSDNKFVSGGLLLAAVSFMTYKIIGTRPIIPNKIRKNRYSPMMNISTIHEGHHEEEQPTTPENSLATSELKLQVEPIYKQEESLLINENILPDELDSIVENINKMGKKDSKDSSTNSMSSFLELNNTGSMTGTGELEFTNVDIDENNLDKILKEIINQVVIKVDNIYGSPGMSESEEIPKLKQNNFLEEYKDKEYNSDLDEKEVDYYSEDETRKIKKKKKFLKSLVRRKSN